MKLIRPAQVAKMNGVTTDTISRWVRIGALKPACRTAGGQSRFDEAMVRRLNNVPIGDSHDNPAPLISAADVAAIRHVSRCTVLRWVNDGWLKPARFTPGGRALFDEAAVREWKPPPRRGRYEPRDIDSKAPQALWRPRTARVRNYGRNPSGALSSKECQSMEPHGPAEPLLPPPPLDEARAARRRAMRHVTNVDRRGFRAQRRARAQRAADRAAVAAGECIFEDVTREMLYSAVWEAPRCVIERRFGLSKPALLKVCQKYDIPRPPNGYWKNIQAKTPTKRFHQIPLPPLLD